VVAIGVDRTASGDTVEDQGSAATLDVAARLRRRADEDPQRLALVAGDTRWTYGELHERADAACAGLLELGVGAGDRVGLVLGTTASFVAAFAGVLRAGAVAVPLLPSLAPDELRYALADSGARVVLVGPERLDAIVDVHGALPDAPVVVADVPADHDLGRGDGASSGDGGGSDGSGDVVVRRWTEVCADRPAPPVLTRSGDDLAALVYTSGTTGRPRGAMLTRDNLAANQDQSLAGRFDVGPDDVVLLVLPLAHIYSLNVGLGAAVTAGASLVLEERFDPAGTLGTIAANRVSIVLGAPPMYVAWLQLAERDPEALRDAFASVRLAVSGAAPLPITVFERFRALTGRDIEEGYGLTEAAPSVATSAMAPAARPGSVGMPLPGIDLRLVDDGGRDVEPGDPGEIWVRGANVFSGYWHDPEATAAARTADGWLRTGDLGSRDHDGFLYLVDRRRDLILVNGFNVYPREVERVVLEDERVAEVAVVGAEHPLTGQTVVAHVVPREGAQVDVDALHDHLRSQLARYKCPTRIEVVAALPQTATGKVRRGVLRGEHPDGG
jgi:long-chain acyl-CoA synthetase